jgi:hypothetical protein
LPLDTNPLKSADEERRHTLRSLPLRIAWVAAIALLAATSARADNTECTGTLPPGTYDNVTIVSDHVCFLGPKVIIKGNIRIEPNADVVIFASRISGSIQRNGRGKTEIHYARVGGNIQIKNGTGLAISDCDIGGDVQIESNLGGASVTVNLVGGNVQFSRHLGPSRILGNIVRGNLQAHRNTPAPEGGENLVGGNKQDQAEGL